MKIVTKSTETDREVVVLVDDGPQPKKSRFRPEPRLGSRTGSEVIIYPDCAPPKTEIVDLFRAGTPGRRPPSANFLRQVKHRYQLTPEAYEVLFEVQGGRCAICGIPEAEAPRGRLNVDHDHGTEEVRGLLCGGCNSGIGLLGDDIYRLYRAIEYLMEPGWGIRYRNITRSSA